jgi:hypothetical protein
METEVSTKNTKNQILDAYNQLLKKMQAQKADEPKKAQAEKQKQEVVAQAKSTSNEDIVTSITNLKVSVAAQLDSLAGKFVAEQQKFEELQKAIEIEKKNLEDLYQLSANTDSLAAMLLAQSEQREKFEQEMAQRKQELSDKINSEKEQFETEMAQRRAQWKKEQAEQQLAAKEEAAKTKKDREREEEEYLYNLKLTRKKENDLYEEKKQKLEKELSEKKAAFEKEFAERKAAIEEAEAELHELRKKAQAFPAELEKAVADAVAATTEKLETTHQFDMKLREKEVEGELKLKDQIIAALNSKIKEMENSFKEMSEKTRRAESSVNDIALKAIESSSSKPFVIERHSGQNKAD